MNNLAFFILGAVLVFFFLQKPPTVFVSSPRYGGPFFRPARGRAPFFRPRHHHH
jgi:hypothetical protein